MRMLPLFGKRTRAVMMLSLLTSTRIPLRRERCY